ncbi:MAG: hypothetical protein ABSE43_05865 [Steroidobacteraceae bacterium]
MRHLLSVAVLGAAITTTLAGCAGGAGGGSFGGGGPPPTLDSYVGDSGVFLAWADDVSGTYAAAPIGSYAGKKQALRGQIDYTTGNALGQQAGVEIYKSSSGNILEIDLTTTGTPTPQQVSSETTATIDDTCTLSGTAVTGANYDYVGVYFTADLVTPTNSSYFYRLPGPDGMCDTPDDIIHMVKTGMSASSAPIVASGMPLATVRTPQGGISGFVVKSGASLALVDSNFANPVTLGTFAQTINVAAALPVGTTEGYPTGQLYVVDGNIVYVDYAAQTISASLFTIPNWKPTNTEALFAASPTNLYFSINTPASGGVAASTTIYSLPADGSAVPTVVDSEAGTVVTLDFPILGNNLIWGVEDPTYTVRTLVESGGAPSTLFASTTNDGTFIATATTVYYTTWLQTFTSGTDTLTRTGTSSGIVGLDGTVIQTPMASSTFVNGGEQLPWPSDTTTTATAYETVFQVQGLSTVTVTNSTTGEQYVEDAVSGGTLVAIDASSNQVGATIGVLPMTSATSLTGTFRDTEHSGFLEATNAISTADPATRDLYVLNSQSSNSLTQVTNNL